MMMLVPEWVVTVTLSNGSFIRFKVSDNHISNVLRTVSMLTFEGTVSSISVGAVRDSTQHGAGAGLGGVTMPQGSV